MKMQGHKEKTGTAKITSAYNLPAKSVIHTVGPIIYDELTPKDCDLLKNCYTSCLNLAQTSNLKSIAFCCISTGEFRFPNVEASEIASKTVQQFVKNNNDMEVIFNVFKSTDYKIYKKLLG